MAQGDREAVNLAEELGDGLHLRGSFLGSRPGKEYDTRKGVHRAPVVVSVFDGFRVWEVEYNGLLDVPEMPAIGQPVVLGVVARASAFGPDNQPIRNARVKLGGWTLAAAE